MKSKVARPELFFGLVGAVGTDLTTISELLEEVLRSFGYSSDPIHVIELLREVDAIKSVLHDEPTFRRYMSRMDAGDNFRRYLEKDEALALLTANAIRQLRSSKYKQSEPLKDHAYVIRSLKTPREVLSLRDTYSDGFFLIGAYSPKKARREHLVRRIAGTSFSNRTARVESEAEELIHRDEKERAPYGQNVRDTFPMSDFFLDVTKSRETIRNQLDRFLGLIFGNPFLTPLPAEVGMFHAHSAALRSAELGRQVGAVLTTTDHRIISVGTNEVPKAGGGQYWAGDQDDARTFQLSLDTSDELKINNVAEVVDRMRENGWLSDDRQDQERKPLIQDATELLAGTRIMSPIEFGRAVHAEMAAILDAASRGCPVDGTVLYSTTFPCHNCTRHIVGAGIRTVFYIEPYAKSLAEVLHSEAVVVEGEADQSDKVDFRPFVGVAPRQYLRLFEMPRRKNADGTTVSWDRLMAQPRMSSPLTTYLENENAAGGLLLDAFEQTELPLETPGGTP